MTMSLLQRLDVLAKEFPIEGEAATEIRNLLAERDALKAELATAKSDIVCMVEKAADKSLAGYRELAGKCAALEQVADDLRVELAKAREDVERFKRAYEITLQDCKNLTEKVIPNLRENALEEAAMACEAEYTIEGIAQKCAAAIRAMKGER